MTDNSDQVILNLKGEGVTVEFFLLSSPPIPKGFPRLKWYLTVYRFISLQYFNLVLTKLSSQLYH